MLRKKIFIFISLIWLPLYTNYEKISRSYFFSPEITSLPISNWNKPSPTDYMLIENFLREKIRKLAEAPKNERPFHSNYLNTDFYGWVTYRMNRFSFTDRHFTPPKFQIEHFNTPPENKDKCVICYASFPSGSPIRDYPKAIRTMLQSLKTHKFDGHFIYQIGGFPGTTKGRLKYADVPFSFKPFLFEEVRALGYKNILWLDACSIPVKNLSPVFKFIKKNGACFYSYRSKLQKREFNDGYPYLINEWDNNKNYEQISSQIVGINVSNKRANHLLNEWIAAAERKTPFLLSDEPPFMFLVNKLEMLHCRLPVDFCVETPCNTGHFQYWKTNPNAIIYHQYDFLNPQYEVPNGVFLH